MLKFITGGVNSDKSRLVTDDIVKSIAAGKDVLVIVPDQYSFEFDKELYGILGARDFNKIKVTGFGGLCDKLVKSGGGLSGDFADKNARLICMYQALSEVKREGGLSFYKKSSGKPQFCTELLNTFDDMRASGIGVEALCSAAAGEDGLLRDKLNDISLLLARYNQVLERKGLKDSKTVVSEAKNAAERLNEFCGKTVYIHEFSDFSYDEFELISLIISQADKTVVSLIIDSSGDAFSPYKTPIKTKSVLTRAAKAMGVEVFEQKAEESLFESNALKYLSKNIFSDMSYSKKPFDGGNDDIEAVSASSITEEAEYVAARILSLVKGGMKYRDIAVFTRDIKGYYPVLESAFERSGVPFFADVDISVLSSSLAIYIMNIADCVLTRELRTENILRLIKSPMSMININSAGALEEYVLKWGIDKELWKTDFIGKTDETEAELFEINKTRKQAVEPLLKFKESVRDKTADELCICLTELLTELKLSEQTYSIIARTSKSEDREVLEQSRQFKQIWRAFLAAINSIYINLSGEKLSARSFFGLLRVLLSQTAISSPPQYMDAVTVAKAEHSRVSAVKASFVVGLNDGAFPRAKMSGGLITEREKTKLREKELEFSVTAESFFDSERLITAIALLSGKNFLCASYPTQDADGAPLRPSAVIDELKRTFPGCGRSASDMPPSFWCQNYRSAYFKYFDYIAKNAKAARGIREALVSRDMYKSEFSYYDKLCRSAEHKLSKASAKELFFKRDLNLSATRVEDYYKCPFNYFCKNGLKIYPLRKLEISPAARGSLIHFCLEKLMCEERGGRVYYRESFENLTDDEIKRQVHALCRDFSDRELGGDFAKTKRYFSALSRLENTVFLAVKNIAEELRGSLFKPCAFEYDLTREDGSSLLRIKVADGIYINIRGRIDRVDCFDEGGTRYIRITDYKTGGKKLNLSDLYHGLNMQMLVYLLAVISSDNEITSGKNPTPAGILYMPAKFIENSPKRADLTADMRRDMEHTLKLFYDRQFKREGLLVDNEISLEAMDKTFSGLYAPVSKKADGSYKKAELMPMDKALFDELERFVRFKLESMGKLLLDGRIEAKPIQGKNGALSCEYCDYWSVCGNYNDREPRAVLPEDSEKLLAKLSENVKKRGEPNA